MAKRFENFNIFKSLNFSLTYFIGSFPSEDRGKSKLFPIVKRKISKNISQRTYELSDTLKGHNFSFYDQNKYFFQNIKKNQEIRL